MWFGACIFLPEQQIQGTGTPRLARLTLEVRVNAFTPSIVGIGKRAAELRRLVVVMTSGKIVLRDTVTAAGSQLSREPAALLNDPGADQTLLLRYELKPDRPWQIEARVIDALDSVRYFGMLDVKGMDAFAYVHACIPVEARYAFWEARYRLPASIGTGSAKKSLFFSRLAVSLNGEQELERLPLENVPGQPALRTITADPAKLRGAGQTRFFQPDPDAAYAPVSVSYDYVGPYTRYFKVLAYGYIEGDTVGVTPERVLFEGARDVDIYSAKVSVDEPVPMTWSATDVAPAEDAVGINVRLGRAGRVAMQVALPGGVAVGVAPALAEPARNP